MKLVQKPFKRTFPLQFLGSAERKSHFSHGEKSGWWKHVNADRKSAGILQRSSIISDVDISMSCTRNDQKHLALYTYTFTGIPLLNTNPTINYSNICNRPTWLHPEILQAPGVLRPFKRSFHRCHRCDMIDIQRYLDFQSHFNRFFWFW